MRGGRYNNNMNGGGRGGRGGYGGYQRSANPTDTISIRVTEIRQPVTEDVMRRVFDSVGVTCREVQVMSSGNPDEATVVAQFPDNFAAERVMSSLNNRNIFSEGNKMNMYYVAPAPPSPVMPQGNPAGVMPSPMGVQIGGGAAPNAAVLPTPPMYGGAQGMNYGQLPPQAAGAPMYPQQSPPQQQPPMMPPMMAPPGFAMAPQPGMDMMMGGYEATMQSQMGGRGGGMRGRGMGRGGRGGAGFNPMAPGGYQAGGMPFMNQMGMPMGMPMMGYPPMNMMAPPVPNNNAPTVYLSVTLVPTTEPLRSVFVLMEAFGGVVSMRRNQNKREILTVKMASIDDADAVVRYMRRVPFAGGSISAKRFPAYVERNPCSDEGDMMDPETTQYDFTAERHRSPGQRSKAQPSNTVKVTGCAGYSEADLMTYFNSKNFFPERISKDEEGAFAVQVADVETAVKLLISCHGNVCGEERSNVIFVEGPKEEGEGENAEEEAKGIMAN